MCFCQCVSPKFIENHLERFEKKQFSHHLSTGSRGSSHAAFPGFLVKTPVKSMGVKLKGRWRALWGDKVTQQNISDALGKLGLSRKKRLTDT